MPRVRTNVASRRRKKRILKAAKGYYGARSRQYKLAKETLMRALVYAYRDRRAKKRIFRRLWISRINPAIRSYGLSYSRFIDGLKKAGLSLNRKILANLVVEDPSIFSRLAELAKSHS